MKTLAAGSELSTEGLQRIVQRISCSGICGQQCVGVSIIRGKQRIVTSAHSSLGVRKTSQQIGVNIIETISNLRTRTHGITIARSQTSEVKTVVNTRGSRATIIAVATPSAVTPATGETEQEEDNNPSCYLIGFLSYKSNTCLFVLVQHIFSINILIVAASWVDYIFSPPMRCP